MKNYLTFITESAGRNTVSFGKAERSKARLEGRSMVIPIMQDGMTVGEISAGFDIHGKGATSRAAGYQVVGGYSVEYHDPALSPHQHDDGVVIGGRFDTQKKALDEVKRRVILRLTSLGRSAEGIAARKMPTLRDRLKANPKAWAHWSYVETVLPQIAAGQSVVPPVRPDVAGVLRWTGTDEPWRSYAFLKGAVTKLLDTKELALLSQLKQLHKELPDIDTNATAQVAAAAVSGAVARFNKIRSMMETP
jgi:hypothetical protein